ncbi:McrC family protein [Stenotrophomonas indicatrix]|uniref:5-methylcytosine-specific restriction enzyme subunit McrC n=1 Tax=Stenotrophomonas indicatrix TaxID=2045451 RepID=A0A1W1H474_9GAMM|nr:hypothetical protein [Stenotrophomonas indicatrix]SLM26294.1 5-methylcytosine-specific restriction enzyme subunit McrC [Stenotrophomonas indicatrix]
MSKPLIVKEYEEIDLPEHLLNSEGEISAYPSVLRRDFFHLRYKKGKPILQAGGYIGVIPINSKFSIEIHPKVPISNLERIIFLANHSPLILKEFRRRYSPHHLSSKNLSSIINDFLLLSVEEICVSGILKLYSPISRTGFSPRGRINMSPTMRARAKSGDTRVVYSCHSRGIDFPANQLLKLALTQILQTTDVTENKKRRARVIALLDHFQEVSDVDDIGRLLSEREIEDHLNFIPSTKDSYRDALSVAKLIVQGKGLELLNGRDLSSTTLILNLDEAFEGYVLATLRESVLNQLGYRVLDGNKSGDFGCKGKLFSQSPRPNFIDKDIVATPDIVVVSPQNEFDRLVIDVKYKAVAGIPDRSDINQVVTYAFAYKCKWGMLVLPASDRCPSGLRCAGIISGIEIFFYFMDLSNSDIEKEEQDFAKTLLSLFLEQPEVAA